MITQRVSPQKIKPWQGILMILAILALLLLATVAVNLLGRRVEPIWGQLAVLLVTGLGAYALMRNYVLEYQYTVSQGSFYIERLYGQRTKVMLQVPLSDILFLGQDKAAAAKWPQARIMIDATLSRPLEPMAKICFAYRKDGQIHLGLVQANPQIQKAMFDPETRQRQAQEKWG